MSCEERLWYWVRRSVERTGAIVASGAEGETASGILGAWRAAAGADKLTEIGIGAMEMAGEAETGRSDMRLGVCKAPARRLAVGVMTAPA